MAVCVGTKRDTKNRVLGYYLLNKDKEKKYIEKDKLKAYMKNGNIQVGNLTLTSDNRLVFKDIKGKTVAAYQRKENMSKKSLKEIVLACGDNGYDYEGLHYYIGFIAGNVGVAALSHEIKSAKILNGTEEVVPCAFFNCTELKNIEIPNSVTTIEGGAFFTCSSLRNVTIPNSVTHIGYSAFDGCSSLTNIIIPKSVTEIDDSAFNNCYSLKYMKIPKRFEKRIKNICNMGAYFEFY